MREGRWDRGECLRGREGDGIGPEKGRGGRARGGDREYGLRGGEGRVERGKGREVREGKEPERGRGPERWERREWDRGMGERGRGLERGRGEG